MSDAFLKRLPRRTRFASRHTDTDSRKGRSAARRTLRAVDDRAIRYRHVRARPTARKCRSSNAFAAPHRRRTRSRIRRPGGARITTTHSHRPRIAAGIISCHGWAAMRRGVDQDDGDYPERYRVPPTGTVLVVSPRVVDTKSSPGVCCTGRQLRAVWPNDAQALPSDSPSDGPSMVPPQHGDALWGVRMWRLRLGRSGSRVGPVA